MIPNIFHFIFGLDSTFGGKPFMLIHYLAIKSAYEVNRPDKIFFVCAFEPKSDWYEKSKPYIHVVKIIPPTHIFGNPLNNFSHQSDVIRLERLIEYGGVYLDLDTICVRPLAPFMNNQFVMGEEYVMWAENFDSSPQKYYKGLCNAVILAQSNSPFLLRWYADYKSFRSKGKGHFWAEHSVIIPGRLAKLYPDEIYVVKEDAFFLPSHDEEGLKNLFINNVNYSEAYVHHLWESIAWENYLSKISVKSIMEEDSTYNLIARKYIFD